MTLNDIKPHHVMLVAGAIVLLGAWRVTAALKGAFQEGKLNPASTENIVYQTASVPFSGSLGVWLWEKLHPQEAEGANARVLRQMEAKRAQARQAGAKAAPPSTQSATVKLPSGRTGRGATGSW